MLFLLFPLFPSRTQRLLCSQNSHFVSPCTFPTDRKFPHTHRTKGAVPLDSQRSQKSHFVCQCTFPSLTEIFARIFKSNSYLTKTKLSITIFYYKKTFAQRKALSECFAIRLPKTNLAGFIFKT